MLSNTISFLRDHLFTMPVLAKFAVGMVTSSTINTANLASTGRVKR